VNGTMPLFSSTCWVCYLRPPMKDLFLSGSATSEVLDHPDVAVHHLGHNGQVLPIGRGFTPEAKDTDRTPLLPQQLGISVKVHVEKCGSLRRHGPAVHPLPVRRPAKAGAPGPTLEGDVVYPPPVQGEQLDVPLGFTHLQERQARAIWGWNDVTAYPRVDG